MAHVDIPGTAWFYIEQGPTSIEQVREVFDNAFLNSVSQIVNTGPSYWVFVDMGRQCWLLEEARKQIEKNTFQLNGWNIK